MPYDASLDEKLFAKSWEGNGSKITVGVYSYNNGAKKVQLSRELTTEERGGKPGFAKLGRLTKEELQGILPLLNEALGQL
jgi:hypothetical protein